MPTSDDHIPPATADHARRLVEVELLLLLYRSPETFWSPAAAANFLGADERDTRAHLTRLTAAGLLEASKQSDAFRYAPASPESGAAVAALAEAWSRGREEVLHAFRGSIAQITASSDAFRFRSSAEAAE
jgi:predicted ArsR family transcriptional regulator